MGGVRASHMCAYAVQCTCDLCVGERVCMDVCVRVYDQRMGERVSVWMCACLCATNEP